MITITEMITRDEQREAHDSITIPFDIRKKARFKAVSDKGVEVGCMLERGHTLRDGQWLVSESGETFCIRAADETVATAFADDWKQLAIACYHLGNRHIALQVGDQWLRFQYDHVLADMIAAMGLRVIKETAPFEPESGAYHSHTEHAHEH